MTEISSRFYGPNGSFCTIDRLFLVRWRGLLLSVKIGFRKYGQPESGFHMPGCLTETGETSHMKSRQFDVKILGHLNHPEQVFSIRKLWNRVLGQRRCSSSGSWAILSDFTPHFTHKMPIV